MNVLRGTSTRQYISAMKAKKSKPVLIFIVLLTLSFQLAAQNTEFIRSNFPGKAGDFRKARKNLKAGDDLYRENLKGSYAEALDYYLKANNFNPKSASLNFRIGVCFLKSYYRNLSLTYLENAAALDPGVSKQLNLFLGEAYQYQGNFREALSCYQKYRSVLDARAGQEEVAMVEKRIKECESGLALASNPNVVKFDRFTDKVNSSWDEYCPVINSDDNFMAFTSRRNTTTGGRVNPLDYLYFEDIFFTFRDDHKAWDTPLNAGKPLNGKANDATVDLSPDGEMITIYKNIGSKNFLCESRKANGNWQKPVKFNKEVNNNRFHEPSATYSSDRKTLVFVSDMKSGYGGSDLYFSRQRADGSWGEPVNLGPVLNSPFDEESPFLFNDSTLYYSSKGFNSVGGYDVFMSKLKTDGTWSEPVNLGFPLNSPADDLYLVIAQNGEAYLSSDRMDGYGGFDIYHVSFNFKMEELMAAVPPVFIHGTIIDEMSANGVVAKINIHGSDGENLVPFGTSDNDGKFLASLPSMRSYQMIIQPELCDSVDVKVYRQFGTVYHPDYAPGSHDSLVRTTLHAKIMDPVSARAYQFPVEIIDLQNQLVVARIIPDTNGNFSVELPSASSYMMNVLTGGCQQTAVVANPVANFTSSVVLGMMVNIENVYFDFDRAYIRPDAVDILNRHARLFAEHPNWKVLVAGHTDNMGSEVYNMYLSKKRAQAVVNYLTDRGVKRNQLKMEWHGYSRPVTPNTSQESRQLNRRCELSIVRD